MTRVERFWASFLLTVPVGPQEMHSSRFAILSTSQGAAVGIVTVELGSA